MDLGEYDTARRRSIGSSSDTLPSPSTFTNYKSAGIKSGSRAAAFPNGVGFGFQSVSGLVRERRLSLDIKTTDEVTQPEEDKAARQPAKVRPQKAAKEPKEPTKKKGRPSKKEVVPKVPKRIEIPDSEEESIIALDTHPISAQAQQAERREVPKKIEIPDSEEESIIALDTPPISAQAQQAERREVLQQGDTRLEPVKKAPAPRKRKRKADEETEKVGKPATQSRIKKPKVVKPGVAPKKTTKGTEEKVAAVKKTTGKVSSHFGSKDAAEKTVTSRVATPEPFNLDLEEAVKRRIAWTPVKYNTSGEEVDHDHVQLGDVIVRGKEHHQEDFQSMLGNFACAPQAPEPVKNTVTELFAKGRRIELVAISKADGPNGPTEKVKKSKSPKKKPTTITDRATEQYRAVQEPSILAHPSESPLFAVASEKPAPQTMIAMQKEKTSKPRRKRAPRDTDSAKTSIKRKRAPSPKKKATIIVPMLLSPETAMQKLNKQDFLFGTSSQLAQPESPSFIRALQASFNECSGLMETESEAGLGLTDSKLSSRRASRALWEAAWRHPSASGTGVWQRGSSQIQPTEDIDGLEHIESETLSKAAEDLVHSSNAVGGFAEASHVGLKYAEDEDCPPVMDDSVLVEARRPSTPAPDPVDNPQMSRAAFISLISSPILTPTPSPKAGPTEAPDIHLSPPQLSSKQLDAQKIIAITSSPPLTLSSPSYDEDSFLPSPSRFLTQVTARSPSRAARPALKPLTPNSRLSCSLPMPFKPVAPIAPFHNTANPQKRSNAPTTPTKRPVGRPRKDDADTTPPIKRPVGRPRKDASPTTKPSPGKSKTTATTSKASKPSPAKARKKAADHDILAGYTNIDDIEDSDPALPPSPPVRSTSKSRKKRNEPEEAAVLQLELSQPTDAKNAEATESTRDWPAHRAVLFPLITAAIKGEPMSTDKTILSWHERMLLYEPIVPDELASWLSSRGLKTGWKDCKARKRKKGDSDKAKEKKGKGKDRDKGKRKEKETEDDGASEGEEPCDGMYAIQPWQVYEYLETHSVCCVWDERLRNGLKER